jgi:ketosteroid isomerase-like protein
MHDAKSLVLAYHDAFYRKDRAAARALLASDGRFIGPLSAFDDADAFLDAADVFMKLAGPPKVKAVVAEGDDVCIVYDYVSLVPSIPDLPSVAWFRTRAGKITLFHVHFDPTSIVKAMEHGEIARLLQSRD